MTTSPATDPAPPATDPTRPSLLALVVVGLLGLVVLGLFLRSGGLGTQSFTASVLDDDEQIVGPGRVRIDLGEAVVSADLSTQWIQRQRCPGWVQLTSMEGDATRVHVIATTGAPDTSTGELVDVEDYATWLDRAVGVSQDSPTSTSLLGAPASAGPLVATPEAPRAALVAACRQADGDGGTGIRGPAAGFAQDLVVTSGPVDGLGHVLVLGSAWVGGDVAVAAAEARHVAASLAFVDG